MGNTTQSFAFNGVIPVGSPSNSTKSIDQSAKIVSPNAWPSEMNGPLIRATYIRDVKSKPVELSISSSADLVNIFADSKNLEFKDSSFSSYGMRMMSLSMRRAEEANIPISLGRLKFSGLPKNEFLICNDKEMKENGECRANILKYYEGGFFKEHADKELYPSHTHTMCIFPPQDIAGGEFTIWMKESMSELVVSLSPSEWVAIIFPIVMLHAAKEITRGTKYVIKSQLSLQKDTYVMFPERYTTYMHPSSWFPLVRSERCTVQTHKPEPQSPTMD
jgi:hypothetical protein